MNIGQLVSPREFAASESETGGQAARDRAAWLRELERAQWQTRDRYPIGPPEATHISDTVASTVLQPDLSGKASMIPTDDINPQAQSEADYLPAAGDMRSSTGGAPPAAVNPTATHDTAMLLLSMQTLRSQTGEAPLSFSRSVAEEAPAGAAPQWMARSVHAHVTGGNMTVWIRDARVAPSQGIAVLRQLRSLLRSWGYDLGEFFLNGRAVEKS